jgi:hypothetical protein
MSKSTFHFSDCVANLLKLHTARPIDYLQAQNYKEKCAKIGEKWSKHFLN